MLQKTLWIFAISLAVYSIPSSIVGFIGVFSCNQYADATVTQCGRNGQHSNYFNLVYDNMTCHYISDTTPCMPGNQVIRICYKLFHPTNCQSAINQYGSGAVLFSNPNIPKGILISGIVSFAVSMMCLCVYQKQHQKQENNIPSLKPYYSTINV